MARILLILICAMATVSQARQFDSVLRELGLDRSPAKLHTTSNIQTRSNGYIYQEVTLENSRVGKIFLSLRRPAQSKGKKIPVIFMSTGFNVGKNTTQLVGDVGDNMVVSFDYGLNGLKHEIELVNKYSKEFKTTGSLVAKKKMLGLVKQMIKNMPSYLDTIKKVPLQIALTLLWLKQQPDIDASRINLIAVSMGTQVMPLAQRMFEFHGGKTYASVFGYGGADAALIAEDVLSKHLGRHELKIMQTIIRALMNGFDSKDHLPYLNSKYHLIVNARDEEVFSASSVAELERLTPANKEIIWTAGGHINASTSNLIKTFVDQVLRWGRSKRAINH